MIHCEMLIGGQFIGGPCDQSVSKSIARSPFDSQLVGSYADGRWQEANSALDAAQEAFSTWRLSSKKERQSLLRRIATLVRNRKDELADLLTVEVGKPILWSRAEVDRLAITFELAAKELDEWGRMALTTDYDPRGQGHEIVVERVPRGPVLAIVPYNWPYNLAAHKIAPAIATGNTVVVKPSPQAALSTLKLARLIHEAGCPPGVLNALYVESQVAERMAQDPRIAYLSFTGSPSVGWHLKSMVTDKPVTLELGGDASAIVMPDCETDWVVERLVSGAFGYAGQICISVQHALVRIDRYDELRQRLITATKKCLASNPKLEATVCGPLISPEAAAKVYEWVQEAVGLGATVLAGGSAPRGTLLDPILIENVPPTARLGSEEAFGPVLTLSSFSNIEEAIQRVNRSRYGIQCGVFTQDMLIAEQCFRDLEVGGVIIGDYPTLRFDGMPYGGVKRSGFGREGVRYAMDEMTEPKAMVIRR